MSTPCVVAIGTRDQWRGVPCKMDGYAAWAGAYLVDHIVRHGLAATAQQLVVESAHGWACLGGAALTEPDDFLGGDVVTQASDALDHHHAIWVIDADAGTLEAHIDGAWQPPAMFAPLVLPPWYPQPDPKSYTKRRRPEAITRALQTQCRELGLDWGPTCEALRNWVRASYGDLTGVAWLYLGGASDERVRCLIDDTFVYAAIDSSDRIASSADGRLRKLDIDAVDALEAAFVAQKQSPTRALTVLTSWLTHAAHHDHPGARVSWFAGDRRWEIDRAPSMWGHAPSYLMPSGVLPTLLCWLF